MKRVRYFNPWYFALIFSVLYSAFNFYLFRTLNPAGTPLDIRSFFFGQGSGLVALLSVYLGHRIMRNKQASVNTSVYYLLLFLISALFFQILYNLYWAGLVRYIIYGLTTTTWQFIGQNKLMTGTVYAPLGIATILGLYNEKVYKLNQDILLKEKMLSEARLTQLQQQVDPHFLFNNLNILASLIRQSPEQAEVFTQRLSELYRYYLRSGNQSLTTIREELLFMQDYLYLLEVRFGQAFRIKITKTEEVVEDESFLVAGTLQLLLENVVKHNAASAQEPMTVSLNIYQDKLVMENIIRERDAISEGIGLINLEKRYQLITGSMISYTAEQGVFRVTIPLVKQLKQNIKQATV